MKNSIFKFGELPEFKKFTPENINKEFPKVIEKINLDFQNIEDFLFNYLNQNVISNYVAFSNGVFVPETCTSAVPNSTILWNHTLSATMPK